jgi:hypothetical protein
MGYHHRQRTRFVPCSAWQSGSNSILLNVIVRSETVNQHMAPKKAAQKRYSCLLSEFSEIPIRNWFGPPWRLFAYFSAAGVLTVILAILGKADGLALKFTAQLPYGAAAPLSASACTIYGYIAEVNHGLTYILIAPLFVALAVQFARSASEAFSEAEQSKNIVRMDEENPDRSRRDRNEPEVGQAATNIVPTQHADKPGVTKWIGKANRNVFTWLFFVLLAALVIKNFAVEIGGYKAAMTRATPEWDDVGHVQAPLIKAILKRFDTLHSVKDKVDFLSGRPELLNRLEENLAHQVPNVALFTTAFANSHDAAITDQGRLVRINLKNDAVQKNLQLNLQTFGGPDPGNAFQMICFYLFGAIALTLEGIFQAVAVWTLLKVLAYISFLWIVARNMDASKSGRVRYKLRLELYDSGKRYGLGMFHFPYNLIVALIALALLLFDLIRGNTSAPYSTPVHPDQYGWNTLFALSFTWVAVFIGILALCLGPIGFFGIRFAEVRQDELEDLGEELSVIPISDTAARDKVRDKMTLVKSQTAWPKRDVVFRVLAGLAMVFLGVPAILGVGGVPFFKDVAALTDLPAHLKTLARSSCYLLHPNIANACPLDEVDNVKKTQNEKMD